MDQIRELYQEVIIDHGRHPRNFGSLEHPTHHAQGFNPLCGDQLYLDLFLEGDIITDVAFRGEGCAISMASASLMTETLKGKTIAQAEQIFHDFHQVVTEGKVNHAAELAKLGKLSVLTGVCDYPARVKCATLAWHTMHNALSNQTEVASTDDEAS
jgi:nitrogen fixation NifU-like protein